jgi:hypothetical protein
MAKMNLADVALPQEPMEVDGVEYYITAMPATEGLKFMEQHQESIDTGKADLALMKKVVCMSVTKDGKVIGEKAGNGVLSFDVVFARKYGHLRKVYNAALEYNFEDVFQEPDSED